MSKWSAILAAIALPGAMGSCVRSCSARPPIEIVDRPRTEIEGSLPDEGESYFGVSFAALGPAEALIGGAVGPGGLQRRGVVAAHVKHLPFVNLGRPNSL